MLLLLNITAAAALAFAQSSTSVFINTSMCVCLRLKPTSRVTQPQAKYINRSRQCRGRSWLCALYRCDAYRTSNSTLTVKDSRIQIDRYDDEGDGDDNSNQRTTTTTIHHRHTAANAARTSFISGSDLDYRLRIQTLIIVMLINRTIR